jgi:hypothetical protein
LKHYKNRSTWRPAREISLPGVMPNILRQTHARLHDLWIQ